MHRLWHLQQKAILQPCRPSAAGAAATITTAAWLAFAVSVSGFAGSDARTQSKNKHNTPPPGLLQAEPDRIANVTPLQFEQYVAPSRSLTCNLHLIHPCIDNHLSSV